MYQVAPIKTEEDYQKALELLEKWMEMCDTDCEGAYLVALSIEIEKWENEHYPIPKPSLIDKIMFRIDQDPRKFMQVLEIVAFVVSLVNVGVATSQLVWGPYPVVSGAYLAFSMFASYILFKIIRSNTGDI